MASKAEKEAAKREAAERTAQAKREAAEKAANAKREAAEKKAEQQRAAAEKAAEAKRAKAKQQKSAADAKAAAAQKAKDDKANKAKAAADNKAKAAADKKAAAEKAATTYNDQGLNAAQQAQIAKLQKQANQQVTSGYMGTSNQAAIDKAKAEIEKIQAQGKIVLDKQYQEKNAPKMQEAKDKLTASRAQEAQAAQQAQAARVAQVQNRQQQVGQEMAQRQDPNQSYANPYFAMTQNMPAPVGMFQGPNSQQAQTTMIGAGGNQSQQMSPAQMAQMAHMQQMQGQGYGPQGIAQGMPPGMGQQGMPQGIPPQILAMLQARQAQQQPAPQGQPAPQQAPQVQPVRQDMSTFNAQAPVMAAYGGIMRGYK